MTPRRFRDCGVIALALLLTTMVAGAQVRTMERIRAVVLLRDEVFDSTEALFWPYRVANALHAETRAGVVRRELLFGTGDPFDSALVAESERNLRALGIFRAVRIDAQQTDSGVVVWVRTADAWTTTVGVGVATSGTQSVVDLSLQDGNLFGTRTVAVLAYRNEPDRSAIAALFDTPRAIGDRIGVGASLVDRSDGRSGSFSLRLPFLSLSAATGGSVAGSFFEGRILRFAGGTGVAVDSLWRQTAVLRVEAARAVTASPRGYLRVGVAAQLRRDDLVPLVDRAAIPRSLTFAAGPYVAARSPRYVRVRNVESMDRIEDVDLGPSLSASLLLAPAAWGYERSGLGASLGAGIGTRVPSGFARLGARVSALRTADGTDSATVEGGGTLVLQPGPRHLLVAHASGGLLRHPVPGREFDLGLGTGLRAFPAHAFTGDREFVLAGEYRWLVWPRLFGLVGVGAAVFAGQAGAWYEGSPRRTGTEAGAGLRLGSIREVGGVWRLDLSRRGATDRLAGGWVASIGRGFVFGGI